MKSESNVEAAQEIDQAAVWAGEVYTMATEIENDLLPSWEASVDSEELEFTFRCIDNFVDRVLPALGHDLEMLEKVVGSLELYNNKKKQPMNSLLKDLVGANSEIPTISTLIGDSYKGLTEGECFIKYCNEFHVNDADELLDMLHGPRKGSNSRNTEGGYKKSPKT